jgi:hypothetical protein
MILFGPYPVAIPLDMIWLTLESIYNNEKT